MVGDSNHILLGKFNLIWKVSRDRNPGLRGQTGDLWESPAQLPWASTLNSQVDFPNLTAIFFSLYLLTHLYKHILVNGNI